MGPCALHSNVIVGIEMVMSQSMSSTENPRMRSLFLTAFAWLCVGVMPAYAAGVGLKEYSADAMAAAYAGAAASDSDASYLAYNPASSIGVVDTDMSASLVSV